MTTFYTYPDTTSLSSTINIGVTPSNDSCVGTRSSITLRVRLPQRIFKSIPICEYTNLPLEVGGELILNDTFFTKTFIDSIDCDRIITYSINKQPTHRKQINSFLCNDRAFSFKDTLFEKKGTYSLKVENINTSFCDSIFTIKLDSIFDNPIEKIECKYIEDLNVMKLSWDENPNIEMYNIFINGDFLISQESSKFQYPFIKQIERVDLKIFPKAGPICHLKAFEKTFFRPEDNSELKVIPNPGKGKFYLQPFENVIKVTVIDFKGKQLFETDQPEIDLSKFAIGNYFLKIEKFSGTTEVKKLIKIQ